MKYHRTGRPPLQHRVRDVLFKLALIPFCVRLRWVRSDLRHWKHDFWDRDLNDYWCCSCIDNYGQQVCGCYAATVEEEAAHHLPEPLQKAFRTRKGYPFN